MIATTARAAAVDASVPTKELRIAVLVGHDPALAGAVRAIALRSGIEIALTVTSARHASFVERASAIRDARPDILLIAGDRGDADDLVDLAEAARLAGDGQEPRPSLLVAADGRTEARIERAVGRDATRVADPRTEPGRAAIVALVRDARRAAGGALHDETVEGRARALAASASRATVVLDVGSAATSVVVAAPDGAIVAAHAPIGVGVTADRVVERGGLERVRRWIPRAIDASALLERVFNRTLCPDVAPASALALAIEMALARECVARVIADAERSGIAIGGAWQAAAIVCDGRLASWPRPQQTVLVALDALAPTQSALVSRGTDALALVVPLAPRRPVVVRVADGSGANEETVGRGALVALPTTGAVEVTVAGSARPATADALAVGVVIDARGRPLEIPLRDGERVPTLARWTAALAALPPESEW